MSSVIYKGQTYHNVPSEAAAISRKYNVHPVGVCHNCKGVGYSYWKTRHFCTACFNKRYASFDNLQYATAGHNRHRITGKPVQPSVAYEHSVYLPDGLSD